MSVIFWVDVESTGAALGVGSLLEIAAIPTDQELKPLGEFHAVIQYSEEEILKLKEKTSDFVIKMHDKTGLWDELLTGDPIEVVQRDLIEFAEKIGVDHDTRLAGNSVRHDANMIEEFLPEAYSLFSFRLLDVSSISYMTTQLGIPMFEKKFEHTALSDIKESIAEYEYLLSHLKVV